MFLKIQLNECTRCCSCVDMCDENALRLIKDEIKVDDLLCTRCGVCVEVCPLELITME